MVGYLHEIAAICDINKKMTYHTAHHTSATTVTLSHGAPLNQQVKMLGHAKITTTQIHAKVIEQKLSFDMKALKINYRNIYICISKDAGKTLENYIS